MQVVVPDFFYMILRMTSSIFSSISTSTTGIESRYNALTHDQLQLIGASKGLQDFLPRAVDFLRLELTGNNATLVVAYLMGGQALPDGLDAPVMPIDGYVKEHLHDLLSTRRYGLFGVPESAQKTFDKLDWLNNQVQELTRCVRQSFPYEVCSELKIVISGSWFLEGANRDDVGRFFRAIYRHLPSQDARTLAERWAAHCGDRLDFFMGWLESLWSDGLTGREHRCLMQILDAMLVDASFRQHCFGLARNGFGDGGNSVRLNLLDMQVSWLERQANIGELSDLEIYRLGRSDFWMAELIRIVQDHADEGFFDEWKGNLKGMVLNVRFHLHDELKFPGVPIEPYAVSHSGMSKEALKVVRTKVRDIARGDGDERLREALLQWSPWRQLIKQRYIEQFRDLDVQFASHVTKHHEQAEAFSLREDVLIEQCNKLLALRGKARAELLSDLTGEVVRQLEAADRP